MTGMAWVNGGRHEFEASIDWSRKVLAMDPKNPAAYGLIGDAAVEMGDYDEAYDQYQKMLDIKPDLSSYGRSAHLLQITGDTRRATWLMMKGVAAGSHPPAGQPARNVASNLRASGVRIPLSSGMRPWRRSRQAW